MDSNLPPAMGSLQSENSFIGNGAVLKEYMTTESRRWANKREGLYTKQNANLAWW